VIGKSVNLGNWLVLEKWMSPALFASTNAEDEIYLCMDLDEKVRHERS
jgi:glucan 1,3-beta-glucosidase